MSVWERKDLSGTIKENELNLNEQENNNLQQLKELCTKSNDFQPIISDLRDATYVRFLRRQSFDAEKTLESIKIYLKWRQDNNVDKVLETPNFPGSETIRKIVPYAYSGYDNDGRPIYIEKTGKINVSALGNNKIVPEDRFMHSHVFGMETLHVRLFEASKKRGQRVDGICTILDMDGLGFHHRSVLHILQSATEFDNKYYPDMLGKLYVINTPWVAPYIYQAVQLFLDASIKSKVEVINDANTFLKSVIPAESLPVEYGGAGETVTVHDSSDLSENNNSSVDGLEQELVSYDFEKILECGAEGGLFNWFFECENGYDIDFSVEMITSNTDPNKKTYAKQPSRCVTNKGSYTATGPTKLIFRWDNNFSYFTSKNIKYLVACMKEDDITKST